MKLVIILVLGLWSSVACQSKKATTDQPSDPCLLIDQTLIGAFTSTVIRGTMTFSGGVSGTVDIAGIDVNDVTCSYAIADCAGTTMSMICDGGKYDAAFQIITRDSIMVDNLPYVRER